MNKLKKLFERLLIFFIGLPAVVVLVLFLPYCKNLVMNIVIVFLSGIGAVELSSMFKKKDIHISKYESFILGALAPLAITLNVSFNVPPLIIPVIAMTGACWALVSGIFSRSSDEMQTVLNKVIGGFSLLVYPGFFMYWLIKMNLWGNNYIILLFLLIIFASDSVAWLFGSLFGKNNRGIIAVSPNKSVAGFLGGLLGPLIISVCAVFFFSSAFFPQTELAGVQASSATLLLFTLILGSVTSIAAMLGDLAESAIKRSCDFKDSGNLMLGRGGVLDSIDSIALAAPVFYLLYYLLFINI